ncbi:hypothetical protein DW097_22525 [Enterocloster clostridioformis]|nr:hypothetical protein [Enterocloster bolteae]RGB83102.1 hypothetical protein DW097_22525 [Enterocloster clostridioformis]
MVLSKKCGLERGDGGNSPPARSMALCRYYFKRYFGCCLGLDSITLSAHYLNRVLRDGFMKINLV